MAKSMLEIKLNVATEEWSVPVLTRTYKANKKGEKLLRDESKILTENGYEFASQSEDGGHIHAGRILLTGGLSVFAGRRGIRSQKEVTITYQLKGATPVPTEASDEPDALDQLERLAKLRDDGVITTEDFEAKKRQLLGLD